MIAVFSDVHGNLEALSAVLADIRRRGVGRCFCLGDVVGYGPDPAACVDRVLERCEVYLAGNHEHALLSGAFGYSRIARDSIDYARRVLEPGRWSLPRKRRRWKALQRLPYDYLEGGIYYCHASPRDPINEYILPLDCIQGQDKLREVFSLIDDVCLVGHTHTPGVFTDRFQFLPPESFGGVYDAPREQKAVINIGSVGQPRDGDNRACYVLFDGGRRFEYVRLEYDFRVTMAKIHKNHELSGVSATRLEKGI